MANEKFLKESGLTQAVTSLKTYIDNGDAATLANAKKYLDDEFEGKIQAAGAMVLKGSISKEADLPVINAGDEVAIGDTYVVAGVNGSTVIDGQTVRNGDTFICTDVDTSATWTVVQNNVDVATASVLGLVKGGTTNGKTYGVQIGTDGSMTVAVPWTDESGNNKLTQAQVDARVQAGIQALDVADQEVADQFVSAVSETDGKISVSRKTLPNTNVTSKLIIGNKDKADGNGTASNANGNTYVKLKEGSAIQDQFNIKGANGIEVKHDAGGNITISDTKEAGVIATHTYKINKINTVLGATVDEQGTGEEVYSFADSDSNYIHDNDDPLATIKGALSAMDTNIKEDINSKADSTAVTAITQNNYNAVYTSFNDNYALTTAEVKAICENILK